MMSWLPLIGGPFLGAGAARLWRPQRLLPTVLGALVGQLLAITVHARWQRFELARLLAHPPGDRAVAFLQWQASAQQRVGNWMMLAGIAMGVAVLVLLLPVGRDPR